MKAIKKLLFAFLVLGLCSCNSNDNKINFKTGDLTQKEFIELKDQESLDLLRDSKQDFIVYAHTPGCLTCVKVVEPKLQNYIDNYGLTIYKIVFQRLDKNDPMRLKGSAPTIGLYKEGKALDILSYNEDFDDEAKFKKKFEEYVKLPSVYYISPSMLDAKILNKEKFVVLFTRTSCPDCNYLFTNFLDEYINKNDKTFFIIECDVEGIRLNENLEFDETMWQAFKDKYGLSSSTSKYGYLTGVVPTFQYYQDGVLSDSDIYVNESYEYKHAYSRSENGKEIRTYEVTITASPLKNLVGQKYSYSCEGEINVVDLNNFVRNQVVEEHNTALTNFLSKYL